MATKKRPAKKAPTSGGGAHGVTIRMYRLGVGDCFLLRFDREGTTPYNVLIDCGVHTAQAGGTDRIRKVVADIAAVTESRLDVLVVTHEHWDHVSGFSQAEDLFDAFEVLEVWVAWTEDASDAFAKTLRKKKERAIRAVGLASEVAQAMTGGGHALAGLVGFLGDTTGTKLKAAAKVVKRLANGGRTVKYREPGERPITLDGVDGRVYVLGPPRSKEAIGRSDPKKGSDEVYSFGSYGMDLDHVEAGFSSGLAPPFDGADAQPLASTRGMDFFQRRYWADENDEAAIAPPTRTDLERMERTQAWRRIDEAWLDSATNLALKLDEDTNNTSLVLAFELGDVGGPVLLFAADAQVGNWLSWSTVEWDDVGGQAVTGRDLLSRTLVYKVGHHASHNATLKERGLEWMDALELALVPTDAKMAKKVGWGTLPWPGLLERLDEKTKGRVVRTDEDFESGERRGIEVVREKLYYEVKL